MKLYLYCLSILSYRKHILSEYCKSDGNLYLGVYYYMFNNINAFQHGAS